jgi:predicted RNase H-like HicB family nuclease
MWTTDRKLDALMRLPWTLLPERDAVDGTLVIQVAEVPDAIATGRTPRELALDLWQSLRASLEIRLEHGDAIPLPAGRSVLPWDDEGFAQHSMREIVLGHANERLTVRPLAFA